MRSGAQLPVLVGVGERDSSRFPQFFAAGIRNPHKGREPARVSQNALAWVPGFKRMRWKPSATTYRGPSLLDGFNSLLA